MLPSVRARCAGGKQAEDGGTAGDEDFGVAGVGIFKRAE